MDEIDAAGLPVPFSIKFYTADLERDTGGECINITLPNARKFKQFSKMETPVDLQPSGIKKAPHHGVNFTRNIQIDGWEHPVKVHGRLITRFNGKRVVW